MRDLVFLLQTKNVLHTGEKETIVLFNLSCTFETALNHNVLSLISFTCYVPFGTNLKYDNTHTCRCVKSKMSRDDVLKS